METLSIKFGLELQSARIVIPNKPTYDIRVGNIAQSQNFSLRLVRNWKATEVRFQADPFAADFVSFLNARIIESRSAIMNIRDERKRFYSRFTLEIEGLPFESVHRNNGEGGFDPEKFCFVNGARIQATRNGSLDNCRYLASRSQLRNDCRRGDGISRRRLHASTSEQV
jgi:hypothetical protein